MNGFGRWSMRLGRWAVPATVLAAAGGCQWQKPAAAPAEVHDAARSAAVALPPKQLVQVARRVLAEPPLNMPVASEEDGVLLTGWREYEGALHIVRHWQERTRFKVTILPDFNDPTTKSRLLVVDETQEKPSDPQPWYPNPDLRRPERSAEVVDLIQRAAATQRS